MLRPLPIGLLASAVAIATAMPAMAEIVTSRCKLIKYYGDRTTIEIFDCDFRQTAGNVQVWSDRWNFEFPYAEQGKTYIRINRIPLTFTRTAQYTLYVTQ